MTPNIFIKNKFSRKAISLTIILLKGLGQIMLQGNSVTGFLFLVGIFYGSLTMGIAALLATICGTTTAFLLKYDKAEINKGLYGFSAALVGVAIMLFLKPVFISWIILVIGSALATVIQHFFMKRKIPVFTLPFVVITWLILFFTNNYFTGLLSEVSITTASSINYFTVGFKGYGQVIFQGSIISGILFFIGILISSPISALYGLAGAIISAIIAFIFSAPVEDISIGLFSFNAVLCAIVFSGKQMKDCIWSVIAVILSLFISLLLLKFDIMQLTFPFVLASCIILFVKEKYENRFQNN
ncbi:Urea transporter [Chryseobacterium sp. MOF25P]|uniref:urea transporter n=1 Tax=unclassified Chryseobacterium TaxID=2593645 RepID=UPI000805ACBE|nr:MULTISPECIES: urea transporter [unclassified Chryseobacterium]OBW41018.1 Urea transporter [Chryseobacterium sp. MOF25P]OBW47567.1 Urea transporter [Chryseobacterium sp. BGARF1]